ncbi:hypothetical protein MPER_06649 [Moniliophthora perniciosa FA553]|nr:hypothetical protein MPER_06649 [Moniliophthora perniciosa FA553]
MQRMRTTNRKSGDIYSCFTPPHSSPVTATVATARKRVAFVDLPQDMAEKKARTISRLEADVLATSAQHREAQALVAGAGGPVKITEAELNSLKAKPRSSSRQIAEKEKLLAAQKELESAARDKEIRFRRKLERLDKELATARAKSSTEPPAPKRSEEGLQESDLSSVPDDDADDDMFAESHALAAPLIEA